MNREDMVTVQLRVNGLDVTFQVPPLTTLQEALHRNLELREVRYGCGEGVCGACLVLLNGKPASSCLKLAVEASGSDVVTAVGLPAALSATGRERYQNLRANLEASAAFQCGYCASGVLVAAAHFLDDEQPRSATEIRRALSGNLCRCTGYRQMTEAILAAAEGRRIAEDSLARPDVSEKMGPDAGYPTDLYLRETLIGRVLWSEYASARIREIDVTAARTVPGVVAVLTYEDIPGTNVGGTMTFAEDQPLLVSDRVRCRGDAVALVAATSELAAMNALQKIHVAYEPLPPITEVTEAAASTAPSIGRQGNIISQFTEQKGDVDSAFAAADLVVEGSYRCTSNDHACMELEGGSGWMEGDTVVLLLQSQNPYGAARGVARQLAIPTNRVRILSPRMGGSFGKYLTASTEAFLALLVYKTRKPVRLVLSREECLSRRAKRHATVGRYRLGIKRDGSFTALEAHILADAGPYVSLTPAVVSLLTSEASGAYEIANVRVDSKGVLTNNLSPAPMRGYGSQQANFGIECLVEKAAHRLGADPAELRRKNYRGEADVQGNGKPAPASWIAKTMDTVTANLGARPAAPPGWLQGRGVATAHAKYGYPSGMVDRFVARISTDSEGRFTVESDISDAGSGSTHGVCRLVAKALHLPQLPTYVFSRACAADPSGTLIRNGKMPSRLRAALFSWLERVQTIYSGRVHAMTSRYAPGTLARVMRFTAPFANRSNGFLNRVKSCLYPFSVDSFNPRISGSRAIFMLGRAAQNAADNLRQAAFTLATGKLGVEAKFLELGEGVVYDVANPSHQISWAALAQQSSGKLFAVGESHLPKRFLFEPRTGNQVGPVDFVYASHGCDLAVNPKTGQVLIQHFVACHDVGRALDPEAIRGQLIGGITMGIAQALWENIVVREGKVETLGLHDYLVPSSLDVPQDIEVHLIESGSGLGPEGAKGIGEIAAVVAPITVANAIYGAVGVQPSSIPITPEDIVCDLAADCSPVSAQG